MLGSEGLLRVAPPPLGWSSTLSSALSNLPGHPHSLALRGKSSIAHSILLSDDTKGDRRHLDCSQIHLPHVFQTFSYPDPSPHPLPTKARLSTPVLNSGFHAASSRYFLAFSHPPAGPFVLRVLVPCACVHHFIPCQCLCSTPPATAPGFYTKRAHRRMSVF